MLNSDTASQVFGTKYARDQAGLNEDPALGGIVFSMARASRGAFLFWRLFFLVAIE